MFNYFYSGGMGRALAVKMGLTDRPLTIIPQIHVIVGVSVLVLVLIRLALRASRHSRRNEQHSSGSCKAQIVPHGPTRCLRCDAYVWHDGQ